jgi:hypothetical protein
MWMFARRWMASTACPRGFASHDLEIEHSDLLDYLAELEDEED